MHIILDIYGAGDLSEKGALAGLGLPDVALRSMFRRFEPVFRVCNFAKMWFISSARTWGALKLTACFFSVVVASIMRALKTMVYFRTVGAKKLSASGKA